MRCPKHISRPYQNTAVAPQVSSKMIILSAKVNTVHARRWITYFISRSSITF